MLISSYTAAKPVFDQPMKTCGVAAAQVRPTRKRAAVSNWWVASKKWVIESFWKGHEQLVKKVNITYNTHPIGACLLIWKNNFSLKADIGQPW